MNQQWLGSGLGCQQWKINAERKHLTLKYRPLLYDTFNLGKIYDYGANYWSFSP